MKFGGFRRDFGQPGGPREPIMMLTSDISLLNDPLNSYQQYVSEFAEDQEAFDTAFAAAWYKLTARDMGEPKSLSQTRWINTI